MKKLGVLMAMLLATYAADAPAVEPPTAGQRLPLIVDTDLGFDDCSALLYLLDRPDVEILAVTIAGMGEVHCRPGLANVFRLCKLAGRFPPTFPVACGDEEPNDGYQAFPARWRNDADTFFGEDVAVSPRRCAAHAVDVIVDVLKSAKQPATLLTLGPLSNIAALFERAPWVKGKLARIYIMGGAVNVGGNIRVPGVTEHLQNRVAEWNIYVDPVAARSVFRAGVPISLISLDGTQRIPIVAERVHEFTRNAKTPEAQFIVRWCQRERQGIEQSVYCYWDTLAAMAAVDADICRYTTYKLDVVVTYAQRSRQGDLPAFSAICRNGRPRRTFEEATVAQTRISEAGTPMAVCTDADADKFRHRYIQVLNRQYQPGRAKGAFPAGAGH